MVDRTLLETEILTMLEEVTCSLVVTEAHCYQIDGYEGDSDTEELLRRAQLLIARVKGEVE